MVNGKWVQRCFPQYFTRVHLNLTIGDVCHVNSMWLSCCNYVFRLDSSLLHLHQINFEQPTKIFLQMTDTFQRHSYQWTDICQYTLTLCTRSLWNQSFLFELWIFTRSDNTFHNSHSDWLTQDCYYSINATKSNSQGPLIDILVRKAPLYEKCCSNGNPP